MPQNHVLRVSTPAEHESDMKSCYKAKVRVYTSIFVKFSNLPFNLEIGFNGVLIDEEHKYRTKNRTIIKLNYLSLNLEIGYVGGFKASGTQIWP